MNKIIISIIIIVALGVGGLLAMQSSTSGQNQSEAEAAIAANGEPAFSAGETHLLPNIEVADVQEIGGSYSVLIRVMNMQDESLDLLPDDILVVEHVPASGQLGKTNQFDIGTLGIATNGLQPFQSMDAKITLPVLNTGDILRVYFTREVAGIYMQAHAMDAVL